MPDLPPFNQILATAIVIFFAIGLHEYAHCKTSDMLGDTTARMQGRVTLNLTKHFEVTGTIMIILTSLTGIGIGWGKAAPFNPRNFENPVRDTFLSVIAGPVSNLLQAGVWAILFKIFVLTGLPGQLPQSVGMFLLLLTFSGVLINLALFFFNLVPLGVLDGHWLVGLLLPEPSRTKWFQFQRTYGSIALLGLVIFSQMSSRQGGPDVFKYLVDEPVVRLTRLLLGSQFI